MAVPITAKTFKMLVADALDGVFREVYGEKSFENEYMVEVNFDGQDESRNACEATHASTSK